MVGIAQWLIIVEFGLRGSLMEVRGVIKWGVLGRNVWTS